MNNPLFKILIRSLAASCLLAAPAYAATATPTAEATTATATATKVPSYELVKDKSTLKFTATQNNAPVDGAFSQFDGDITFDPEQLEHSHIYITVDMASLTLADAQTRETVAGTDWLDVGKHPKAVFKTLTGLSRMPGSNDYYAKGELELRGVKAPVTINFTVDFMDDTKVVASGYVTLQRTDYGVGQGEWSRDDVIKKSVRVEFRITANKKP